VDGVLRILPRRIVGGIVIVIATTFLVFVLGPVASGNNLLFLAAGVGTGAGQVPSAAQLAAAKHRLGLDQQLLVQYAHWLGGAAHGDLGFSFVLRDSVAHTLEVAAPVTVSIAIVGMLIAIVIAFPAGVYMATHPTALLGRLIHVVGSAGIATPNFVLGILLVRLFALQLRIFPSVGYAPFARDPSTWLKHVLLPALALGVPAGAALTRYVMTSLSEVLTRPYVRTATAMGLPPRQIVWRLALKNALIPIVTVIGLQARLMLGGAVAVEALFGLPGLGTTTVRAVLAGDYPVVEGVVLCAVVVVVGLNLAVDLSYVYLNPRLRTR
jgi:peptide/nickel transport system permease protein